MAIVLREIRSDAPTGIVALVEHDGRELVALVAGDPQRLRSAIGSPLVVELDFVKLISSRMLESDLLEGHGLYPLESGDVRVVGSVQKVVDIPEGGPLVEVYLRAGPELLTVDASDLAYVPTVGAGLEVIVNGLCFFPTWT